MPAFLPDSRPSVFPELRGNDQGSSRRWLIHSSAQEPRSGSLFAVRAAERSKPKAVPVIPPAAGARGKENSFRSGWAVAKPRRRPLRWLQRPARAPRPVGSGSGRARVTGTPPSPLPTCEMRPGAAAARGRRIN